MQVSTPQVIDLSREQERSRQAEAKKNEAEAQAAAQQYAIVSAWPLFHSVRSFTHEACMDSVYPMLHKTSTDSPCCFLFRALLCP